MLLNLQTCLRNYKQHRFSTAGLMREEEKLFITPRGSENRERALESWAQRGAVPGGLGGQWAPLGCSLSRGLHGQTSTVHWDPLCPGPPYISHFKDAHFIWICS